MGQPSRYTADDIQVLEGLEAVRLRPAMYIGDTSTRGLHHLFYEVIDNSIDEVLNGYCTDIVVTLGKDQIVTVEDNGRGIPIDMHPETGRPGLEVAMTMLHAGGKFGGSGYKVSGGLHGVGVSVVNALSEWCEVTVMRDGKQCRQRYERGVPAGDMEQTGKTKRTGTITSYLADSQIFGEFQHDPEHFVSRIRELAYLNKGVKITFINETAGEDEEREQVFQYRTGLAAYVEHLNRNKSSLHRPVYFAKERDGIDIEVAIQYNETFQDLILTFANNIRTVEGGTHLSGFKTALTRVLNQYARKQGILKEKDRNFSGDDVREGITAVISVKLLSPQFEGQTKTKLGNSEVEGVVNSVVGEGLGTYLEEHPSVGKRVCEKAITASRARDAARKASELVKRQSALEASSLPGRLADCSEKDPMKCELYIVEGESGGGTAKSGRDRRFQAILPLRGKVLNVEKARIDKALSNEEIRSLITAIGVGIANGLTKGDNGNNNAASEDDNGDENVNGELDLDKLRYDRIIIMTDADVDGSHIRMLLLTFFFRYMRRLIEEGHVFIAQPPLYRLKSGKETLYARDDDERIRIQQEGKRRYEVTRFKGLGEMDAGDLWHTTMNPENRTLVQVTIEDLDEANTLFSELMGESVEARREFIQKRAKDVVNLDI